MQLQFYSAIQSRVKHFWSNEVNRLRKFLIHLGLDCNVAVFLDVREPSQILGGGPQNGGSDTFSGASQVFVCLFLGNGLGQRELFPPSKASD